MNGHPKPLYRLYACATLDCDGFGQEVAITAEHIGALVYTWPTPLCEGCLREPYLLRSENGKQCMTLPTRDDKAGSDVSPEPAKSNP